MSFYKKKNIVIIFLENSLNLKKDFIKLLNY